MPAPEHAVVVAGAGPTGLMLAGELALAGADVVIVERRATQELDGPRARGLHARTIEVLAQRGIADRFLAEGQAMRGHSFAGVRLEVDGLALPQKDFERILAGWVDELGVPIVREREVTGFAQDETGVDVALSDGRGMRAAYLVGCDGGRSVIRKTAGIAFDGWDPSVSSLIAEAELRDEPDWGIRYDANGTQAIGRLDDGRAGIVVTQPFTGQAGEPTLDELRRALVAAWGTDYGVHSPTWLSRFTDLTRQAASYREGRVLLAGDAAHVHYPVGGQGLNLGVQDAVNLGWKVAQVVARISPESLLDTYQAERHPVAARVLRHTMAQTALTRSDARVDALRETLAELLGLDEPRARLAGLVSGLDIRYDLGDGHPLLGRRLAGLDLHDGRGLLLNPGPQWSVDISRWEDRLAAIEARRPGLPPAVLVRPDGYVAWTGDGTEAGLQDALTTWFGARADRHERLTQSL